MEVHILASGSDGNCAIVRHEDTAVMIDAGLTGKRSGVRCLHHSGIIRAEPAVIYE